MNREQAKQNLINIGIAEPTEQQVSDYLDQVNGESRRERDRADRYKADASKVADLQKQLDNLNSQNLSDIEKANKERDEALTNVDALRKEVNQMKTLNALAERGITGDDAKNLIREDGSLDFETLGKIITERETAAASAKEAELLKNTPNPSGGNGGNDTKSNAEKLVEQILPAKGGQDNSILNKYINGGN